MTVYVIAGIEEIKDPQLMGKYAELASPTVEAHGGKFVARGEIEKLDGDWGAVAGAVIEFPSAEAVRTWYNSPEYQAALPMRLEAARGTLFMFPGE
ncbi:MAG: DUF1330 domain-containing protein [Alphaproteobacteria bacterium]